MKLPKKYLRLVQFAHFLRSAGLANVPGDAAQLLHLADRAFTAGVRECNEATYDATPARERFETLAKALRLKVLWPGLLPAVVHRGRTVYLPPVS